ncbi:MAG: hypothetical protein V4553_21845 [Bacteroidota bacterium]
MDIAADKPLFWPLWKRIIFRFVFVFLVLQMAPWTWLNVIPYFILKYHYQFTDWLVNWGNTHFFHVRQVLVSPNGSGDTSFGWAQLWLYLTIAALGCIIWSGLDRKRQNYTQLNYWLCLFARYYLVMVAAIYGIMKLFAMQMSFPSLHQLATPLGDYLPMRLSWMFIGYSAPYQVFSGMMEVLVAALLLYRRTTTLGVILATAVFTNVMMLNLCYDIPVKIYSMELVFTCLLLLVNESDRIICFFVLNKPAAQCSIYQFNYTKKWMRITRIILKIAFVLLAVSMPLFNSISYYKSAHKPPAKSPIKNGVYELTQYSVNKQPVPLLITDTLLWQDMILENGSGSIKTGENIFKRRYNRSYFNYSFGSPKRTMTFQENIDGTLLTTMKMQYALTDTNTFKLWGKKGNDSVSFEFKRTKRHFQLAERQFHWLSEKNR